MVDTLFKNMVALVELKKKIYFFILLDTNPDDRPENTPQVFWVRGKRYSTNISDKCRRSGPKDKHLPWYLDYK